MLVPSISEGIPNTIKEALLMEMQVVARPIAGIPEFENISLLSDWDRINQVILDLPRELNSKGRREILNNFSPMHCIEKLLNEIEKWNNS